MVLPLTETPVTEPLVVNILAVLALLVKKVPAGSGFIIKVPPVWIISTAIELVIELTDIPFGKLSIGIYALLTNSCTATAD